MRCLLVTLFVSVGAASLAGQAIPGACFEVEHGEWAPPADLGADSILVLLPSRIRFTDSPSRGNLRPGSFQLEVASGALGSVHAVRGWSESGDTIFLVWSNGYSGVGGALRREGSDLRGTLRTFWDYKDEAQSAEALLRRVGCNAPHPGPTEAVIPIPRSVTLEDGRELRLAEELERLEGPVESRSETLAYITEVRVEGVGLVGEVLLRINSGGQLRGLRFEFPSEAAYGRWLESMVQLLGPPSDSDLTRGEHFMEMRVWRSRNTALSLARFSREDGSIGHSLSLSDWSLGW